MDRLCRLTDAPLVAVAVHEPYRPVDQRHAEQSPNGVDANDGQRQFAKQFHAVPSLRKGAFHALILLLLAAPVQAQEPRLKLALGAYITAGYYDAAITANCHGAGTCHEQNPLLRPIVDRRGVVAAMTVKGAMHAGIAAGLLKLSKEHPQRAFWLTVALTGAQVAVDVANVRTLEKR